MEAHSVLHPSADALRAFALGKLNDATAAVVMNHLDSCPDCCKQVAALSGDDFLERLRQAHSSGSTPAPAKSLAEVVHAERSPASRTPIPNLPPELANNSQYEMLRELGRGGMGVVYLAHNKLMDRREVLKVINKALLDHPGAVERFLREIRAAAKLSHANIVTAHSAVQQGELLAFAMEYVEGQDLASLVKSQGPLPIAHACFYVQQAALGLQHAHEKQMVHRDIKPQNLILAREGKKHIVKVLDFGLAKVMREKTEDTGLTGEGKMLGTPDYIAPEQALDAAKADIRADIYSLGCTLYYLLSGRPPFSGTSLSAVLMGHQMQEAKPLNLVRPEVPEELAAVVRKMMAKSPAKRYQTPREVAQALSPFIKPGASAKSSPELSVEAAEPKSAVKTAARVDRPKAETQVPPKPEMVEKSPPEDAIAPAEPRRSERFSDLTIGSALEQSIPNAVPRKRKSARERPSAAGMPRTRKKWLIGGGIGVGVLLLALLGMWAAGVFKKKVQTPDGAAFIVLNNLPADADVLVDGERVTVTWGDGGKKAEIRVKPGTHKVEVQKTDGLKLEVKKDDVVVEGKELTFKDGDREIFTVRLLPAEPQTPKNPEPNADDKRQDEKWVREVAGLPAEVQVKAVADKLKERNPGFDGMWAKAPGIEGDRVVSLAIESDHVRDLTPLQALAYLQTLHVRTVLSSRGVLTDLGPLKRLPLQELYLDNQPVADLSPLRDLSRLRRLTLDRTKVMNLTPLHGLPLNFLEVAFSNLSDLSPLKGMKEVEHLSLGFNPKLTDLKPLQGLKLQGLTICGTHVEDLSPLKGMPLKYLNMGDTRVEDLSPLKGMELETLCYGGTPTKDIAVLKEMPLRWVLFDFQRERDEAVLRSIKTLETINRKPAAQFWQEVGGNDPPAESNAGRVQEPANPPAKDGFVPLFNGKDLTGWEGLQRYWRVKDGAIVGSFTKDPRFNTFLCSKKTYSDFELKFQVRLKDGIGNSGVQIRSKVIDYQKFIVAGPQCDMGAAYWGSLYGEGTGWGYMLKQSPPDLVKKAIKPSDFNDYYIKCVGKHVTIKINGETMVDNDFAALPDEGIIAWQLHAGPPMEVTFKDIQFTDLSKPRAEAPPAPRSVEEKGFVPLFNGKDLKGWKTHPQQRGNWRVKDGVLIGSGRTSHLFTQRGDFKDFHLRAEVRVNQDGNSGIYFRTPFALPFLNSAPGGYEAQILHRYDTPTFLTGSLQKLVNAPNLALVADEWFTLEIIAVGNDLTIKVNNKTTAHYVDAKRTSMQGHFALQVWPPATTVVQFRKIEIKELPAR